MASIGEHSVVVAGAGPTGLMLAAELALAGVDVALVERRADQEFAGQRARGLHSRTIELFDQRGIADRFLSAGYTAQVNSFAWIRLDIGDFPTRHPYGLALMQQHVERILAGWALDELAVPIYRSSEITGFRQDEAMVDIALTDDRSLRASYLVGCDGGRSVIRKAAGIGFTGWDATTSTLIAEIELTDEPEWGMRRNAVGVHGFSRPESGGPVGALVTERRRVHASEPTLSDLRDALVAVYGTDYGAHNPTSLSRFTDAARQAEKYRSGRVLLAGDAAHIAPPVGGQGLGTGIQDAVNLGWKLAQVVNGTSREGLLDTYHAERHPEGARVLHSTTAQMAALRRIDDRSDALRDVLSDLLRMEEPRRRFGAMMSGLDVRYDFGDGHPLLGRRMPDLDVVISGQRTRVFTLLHRARPVLINFGERGSVDVPQRAECVTLLDATYDGIWELPAIGAVSAPGAVLIRPDGHVAWAGEGDRDGLIEALTRWF